MILALLLTAAMAAGGGSCETECDERGCWLLVYRYTVNVADLGQRPLLETRETFDGQRFPTEEAAYCRAAQLRRTGVQLPTLLRLGRDSNVMPESITPMPHLAAVEAGIPPARPEDGR
jgi:hypothetical protein